MQRRNGSIKSLALLMPVTALVMPVSGQCEIAKIDNPAGEMETAFPGRLASDGDVLLIGDIEGNPPSSGSVYVVRFNGRTWDFEAELLPPDDDSVGLFARSAAVSGHLALIGAPTTDARGIDSGAVYFFRFNERLTEWTFEGQLTASDGDSFDLFGWSTAIDGVVAVIGARDDENAGVLQSGSAYVFRFDGTQWVEEAKLIDPNGEAVDLFGQEVAVSSDVILVGAHGTSNPATGSGSAFVFRRDGRRWLLEAELNAFDSVGPVAWFGFSAALAENVALVGAPQDDDQTGAAYVFRYDNAAWIEEARLAGSDPVGPFPFFGASVSLSSDASTVIVGAIFDAEFGFDTGAAYVFRHVGTAWEETVKLTGVAAGDLFGASVLAHTADCGFTGARGETPQAVHAFAGLSGTDCNMNSEPDACDIFDEVSHDGNANGIPDECEAGGDVNGDGAVNVLDLLEILALWGICDSCPPSCTGDLNNDCTVNSSDLFIVLLNWG